MTTDNKPKATTLVLGKEKDELVRFSYLHVFKPHLNQQSKRHEYSLQVLIPKTSKKTYEAIKQAVDEQMKLWFPKTKPPKLHYPIKDGDTDVNQKGEKINVPGYWVVSAKTDAYERVPGTTNEDMGKPIAEPDVVGTTKDANGKLKRLGSSDVKSGDWGRVSVNVKGYTTGDGGVGVYLNTLQLVREGEALGSSNRDADAAFSEFEDEDGLLD
jgi:Protein of unknown function (DUF2815)